MNTFCSEQSIPEAIDISKKFELFSNFCIIKARSAEDFEADSITSDSIDAGIDGICFIIDGEIATTLDEAEQLLMRPKNSFFVDIFFMQSKTSESYDRGEILKFGDGVEDFVQNESHLPHGEFLKEQKKIFNLLIENVSKIHNGRPDAHLKYVCTSNNQIATEIEATKDSIIQRVKETGVFNEVDFEYIGLEELITLWDKANNSIAAVIPTKTIAPYPGMEGVSQAYLAIVPLKRFVETILMDQDGKIRAHIFEENVRAYLGKQNPVNRQIQESLQNPSSQSKFGILNNGITIISPDVRVQNDRISVESYQIVNGCQTSTVLYENYELINDESTIPLKIVEVTDSDVIAEIVRATNSQSKVEETQFLSYEAMVRRIEKYFDATEDNPGKETKLYFERRKGQYNNIDIPKRRVFNIQETFRAFGAMFLQTPEMAYRYPTKMIFQQYDVFVNSNNKEIVYYTASLALYRFKLLTSNGRIDPKYVIYKWHVLMILYYVGNKDKRQYSIQNKKIESFCKRIISICSQPDEECLALFKKATDVIEAVGYKESRDEIRSRAYTESLLDYCKDNFK